MALSADILIIGAGPAGVRAADILAGNGKKVTLAGRSLGGTYVSEGGVVSNALLKFSLAYDKYRNIDSCFIQGASQCGGRPDFKKVWKYVESMSSKAVKLFAEDIDRENINFIRGSARLIGADTAEIVYENGESTTCKFKKCLIATGSVNRKLQIAAGKKIIDPSSVFSISSVPGSVSIIGGGFIGIETAAFFSRLGSKINIIEKNERILNNVDAAIVKKFDDLAKKREINIYTGKTVTKIERIGQKTLIFFDDTSVESEEVFVCIGRYPYTENLGLEDAGVETLEGVPVFDEFLRTSNKNIYVAGDVAGLLQQSSWSYYSAWVAAENIMGGQRKYDLFSCPSLLATDPAIALVGLSEEKAKSMGYDVGIIKHLCGDIFSFPFSLGSQTLVKGIYDKKSKTLVGAEAIGPDAQDVINTAAALIQTGFSPVKENRPVYASAVFNEFFGEVREKLK